MYQNITQLLEEGLFWKRLGRHERAYRYFSEVAEREPGMGRAWTERMESAAIWMGSLTLVRGIYGRMMECVKPDDPAYPVFLEQAVEFAPDAKAFKAGLIRLQDSGQKPDMFRAIDDMCRELTGDGLDVLLAREAGDDLLRTLLAEYHGRRANSAREKEHPPGVIAIHSQIAAECLAGRDAAEAQGMLLNTQNALLLCHQQMEGVARSHGSVIAKTETYSLDERIRVLEKLDRDYTPDDPMILNRIGASHLLLHNSDEAIAAFERAYAVEKRPKPLINKAAALEQKAWRAFNLQCDVSAAARFYDEAISVLRNANTMPLEKGDEFKCSEDLKRLHNVLNIMKNEGIPLYPSRLIREFSRGQRDFANQYMRLYRTEGADVDFISKMVKKRFDLRNAELAMQCAREMLEDFCPGFVAMVMLNLDRYAIPLIAGLLSIAEDERHGVMTLDAREAIALFGIMDCNSSHDCAERMGVIMSVMNIDQVRLWMENNLEPGLSVAACSPFEWIKRVYVIPENSTTTEDGWDVFISYSTVVDALRTQGLCHFLEERGIRCWMAPRNVLPGEDWQAAIRRGLRHTKRCIVVVLSSSSGNSKQVAREVASADEEGLVIIPFRIEESPFVGDVLKYYFSTTHWINAFPPPGSEALSILMNRIDELASDIACQKRAGSNQVR